MRIGVLTAGGDCPGLNAVIRAVARSAMLEGNEAVGILRGYEGLAKREYMDLDMKTVSGILHLGGTIVGTSSFEPHTEKAVPQIVEAFEKDSLDAVVAIGGEHTMEITRKLYADDGLPLVGVPKTIDNDVVGTDYTFGFDTAVQTATSAIDRLHSTAQSHNRLMIVEVMGRNAGWIAAHCGIAGGADAILIPEKPTTVEEVAAGIMKRHDRGKDFSIIVVSEGAHVTKDGEQLNQPGDEVDEYGYPRLGGIGAVLAGALEEQTGYESRVTVLGHVQRGGTPTSTDRILATRYGVKAYEMVKAGEFGRMASSQGSKMTSVPLEETKGIKEVDLDLLDIARRFYG
ncbi:6-phosphofructokinase [Thermoleophilia bacterium SCSIO 60948]|nr:6-phosphofructokinase [Thermoleophilia bacterium SCSIO 60948]